MFAARLRGWWEEGIMMLVDMQASLPFIVLAITTVAFFGKSFWLLVLIVGYHYLTEGLHNQPVLPDHQVPVADAGRGKEMIRHFGCGGCHVVPGIREATGRVGPRLDRIAEQTYVAGVLPNTPQNMIYWIQHPQKADPKTVMPELGVDEQSARDIAAYLYESNRRPR